LKAARHPHLGAPFLLIRGKGFSNDRKKAAVQVRMGLHGRSFFGVKLGTTGEKGEIIEVQGECTRRNAQQNYRRHHLVSTSTERLKQIRHDLCGGEANQYTTHQDDEEADVDIPQFPARLALTEDINTAQGGENHVHLRQ